MLGSMMSINLWVAHLSLCHSCDFVVCVCVYLWALIDWFTLCLTVLWKIACQMDTRGNLQQGSFKANGGKSRTRKLEFHKFWESQRPVIDDDWWGNDNVGGDMLQTWRRQREGGWEEGCWQTRQGPTPWWASVLKFGWFWKFEFYLERTFTNWHRTSVTCSASW